MLKEMILRREKIIKTIDKERITNTILETLKGMEVMFIYLGGSIAYGTFIGNVSDYDINVFVDGSDNAFKVDIYGMDAFCYGKKAMLERFNPKSKLSIYKKCFIDDYLALPDTLVYLNTKYQKEYEEYKNFKINEVLKGFLSNFYEYFGFCLNGSSYIGKKFYHVIRMRGQLENYKKAGKFTLDVPKSYFDEEIDFKLNYEDKEKQKLYFEKIEKYLNEIYEIKEGMKDG